VKIYEVTEKNKTASFALGRLNPATIGHELLVNAIKKEKGDSFLFLTDRAPKLPKDPLTSQDKLDWARKSFNGISIGLAKTVLVAADRLYKMGYKDVIYLEGDDPEKPFPLSKLIKDYNGIAKELHDYNFNSIQVVQLPRDASAADATGMSGTKMREFVTNNDLEGFKQGVTKSAQPYAEDMFKKLQGIMGVDPVEEGFLDDVKGALGSMMPADMDDLIAWVNKNLRRKGTQWIYRNVNKEFGSKHFTKYDVDQAINIVMKRG